MAPAKPEPDAREEATGTDSVADGSVREMVGYGLKRAYMVLYPAAQAALAELDLRVPSFSCLSVIVRNPGIAPSVLAERLKMERSNIVVIIDELESRELIGRRQSKTDRRRYALTATVRGRRLHDKAVVALHASEAPFLGRLDAEERAQLIALLLRIEASA